MAELSKERSVLIDNLILPFIIPLVAAHIATLKFILGSTIDAIFYILPLVYAGLVALFRPIKTPLLLVSIFIGILLSAQYNIMRIMHHLYIEKQLIIIFIMMFMVLTFLIPYLITFEKVCADGMHEVSADTFALANLEQSDLDKTAAYLRKYAPKDEKINILANKFRQVIIQRTNNLVDSKEYDQKFFDNLLEDDKFGVVSFVDRYFTLSAWISLSALVAAAAFARPQNHTSMIVELCIILFVSGWYLANFLMRLILKAFVERSLIRLGGINFLLSKICTNREGGHMNDKDKDKDVVRKIILENFPEECDAVGPSNLSDLIEEQVKFSKPETGRQFPLLEVIEGLAAAVTFINGTLNIWKALTKSQSRGATKQELQEAIEQNEMLKGLLEKSKREKIIESVSNEFKGPTT